MKKKKLELIITICVYLAAALLAGLLAMPAVDLIGKLPENFMKGSLWSDFAAPILFAEGLAIALGLSRGRYGFGHYSAGYYVLNALRGTLFFGGVWAILLLMLKSNISQSRYYIAFTLILHFVILFVLLYVVQRLVTRRFYRSPSATLVGIVTSRAFAEKASRMVKGDWSRRVVAIALTDEEVDGIDYDKVTIEGGRLSAGRDLEYIDHVPVIAGAGSLTQWAQKSPLDEIFIFSDDSDSLWLQKLILIYTKMGIPVYSSVPSMQRLSKAIQVRTHKYMPRVNEHFVFLTEESGGAAGGTTAAAVAEETAVPLIALAPHEMSMTALWAKRLVDILGGLLGSLIALILYVTVGLAIKLDSPGPILFCQERIGQNGRKFKMYKFRSMYQDAEARKAELMKQNEMNGLMFKMKDDPRITKVGKFIRKTSLDEFPQFFNVLKGDMSLVGTRPPTAAEFQQYRDYHKRRLSMKPGITGMWQTSGHSDITDFEEVVRLDCEYIDNWTLGLDFKILAKTIQVVFTGKGSE